MSSLVCEGNTCRLFAWNHYNSFSVSLIWKGPRGSNTVQHYHYAFESCLSKFYGAESHAQFCSSRVWDTKYPWAEAYIREIYWNCRNWMTCSLVFPLYIDGLYVHFNIYELNISAVHTSQPGMNAFLWHLSRHISICIGKTSFKWICCMTNFRLQGERFNHYSVIGSWYLYVLVWHA